MALSYNLGYQESSSVHPTRRQNFAGKVYSNFPNIWEWGISMIVEKLILYCTPQKSKPGSWFVLAKTSSWTNQNPTTILRCIWTWQCKQTTLDTWPMQRTNHYSISHLTNSGWGVQGAGLVRKIFNYIFIKKTVWWWGKIWFILSLQLLL